MARRSPAASSPDVLLPSRQAFTLGKFEKLVLDLFDNHLSEPERGSAVKTFAAYVRVCHALLDLGLVKESDLTFHVPSRRRPAQHQAQPRDALRNEAA